jgi:hypothetical protein
MPTLNEDAIWTARAFVYEHFASTTRAPTVAEAAARLKLTLEEATAIYEELDRRHAFFLEPGTHDIRIANPFSAIPTCFIVQAQGREYWANCAWDSLGVAAALHSDAVINATYAEDDQPFSLVVRDGQVNHPGAVVHLLVPVQHWYDDMVFT